MKQIKIALFALLVISASACKKHSTDNVVISVPQIQVGKPIAAGDLPAGTYKGTMLGNQTFNVNGDITINAGDTLLIQKGVKVNMAKGTNFIVNGTLISLGTSDAPVNITYKSAVKTTGASFSSADSAYRGGWGGIYCSQTAKLLVIKWTHLDFGGAALQSIPFTAGPKVGDKYIIYYGAPDGMFILEDSWIYGSPDDAIRFYGGHINMMRNTCEKMGATGGDGFNSKSGTQGNMAYNMFIGYATNATKTSNDGGVSPQNQVAMYNNTYVNGGWRSSSALGLKSGSIEIENASRGLAYNNLIVNCRYGVRVAGGVSTGKVYLADTAAHPGDGVISKTAYGYNFYYGDSISVVNQFVPTNITQAVVTTPQATDIPNMKAFLPANYTFGMIYDGSSLIGQNNPMFVNYPLPNTNFRTQASIDGFDFHLKPGSPAINKGYTGFSPVTLGIKVDPNFGSSEITLPGKDIGCYQTNGTGNHH